MKLRFHRALAVALALLAACQPQARRVLVLDLSLSDPTQLDGTARPWHDAGYAVEYRRYYPHLTRSDLARYRTLLLLLGGEPEAPSDALTAADLALLNEWVRARGGGVVVLAYAADGEGSLDRWTANRWLDSQGAGITIGDTVLEDTTARPAYPRAQPWAEGRRVGDDPLGSVYDPFPLDRNHVLAVARVSQVLAVASRHAFVRAPSVPAPRPAVPIAAATRIGDGLVVVMSRHALGALGPGGRPTTMPLLQLSALEGTRDFLTALARWTRRPAEWAHVPPAAHGTPLVLDGAPLPVELQPPPLEPPAGVGTELLPLPISGETVRARGVPNWIRQLGMRALWMPLLPTQQGRAVAKSAAAFDSLVGFLDEAGLNLLAGDAHPEAIADSLHHPVDEREAVRRAWSGAVNLLQPTSVAWIPAFGYGDFRPGRWTDSSRGPRGEALDAPCALDSLFWDSGVVPAYAALARVAGQARQLVPALAFDLASSRGNGEGEPAGYSMGQEFCDAAWRQALTRLGRHDALDSVPVGARYRALREAGLLPLYFGALEALMAQRVRALRDRALKESPGLSFAFHLQHAPGDWFTLGVLRGFSLPDRPLLLFTPELETRDLLAAYRARGLNAVHAAELPLTLVRPTTLPVLKRVLFGENDGFWLSSGQGAPRRYTSDSLASLLRRLAR